MGCSGSARIFLGGGAWRCSGKQHVESCQYLAIRYNVFACAMARRRVCPYGGQQMGAASLRFAQGGGRTIMGIAALLFAAVLVWPPTPARAQTWTGPGTDYNTAANWTPNTVPAAPADTATFSGTVAPSGVNVSATVTAGGFFFAPGAQSYTITTTSGLGLAFFGAGITNNSSNAQNLVALNGTAIQFQGASTAGNATLTANDGSFIQFLNTRPPGALLRSLQMVVEPWWSNWPRVDYPSGHWRAAADLSCFRVKVAARPLSL